MIRHKKKNGLKLYFCFWSFLIIFFAYGYMSQTMKIRNYDVVINNIKREIDMARLEYMSLQKEFENTESHAFFERIAREELGMIKSNEIVFRIR